MRLRGTARWILIVSLVAVFPSFPKVSARAVNGAPADRNMAVPIADLGHQQEQQRDKVVMDQIAENFAASSSAVPFHHSSPRSVRPAVAHPPKGESPEAEFERPFRKAADIVAAAAVAGKQREPLSPRNRVVKHVQNVAARVFAPAVGGRAKISNDQPAVPGPEKDMFQGGLNGAEIDANGEPIFEQLQPGGAQEPDRAAVLHAERNQVEVARPGRSTATIKMIPVDLDVNDLDENIGQIESQNGNGKKNFEVTSGFVLLKSSVVADNIGKLSAATAGLAAVGSVTYCCMYSGRRRQRRISGQTPLPMTNPWPLQPGGSDRRQRRQEF